MISFPKNLESVKHSYSVINSVSNFFKQEEKEASKNTKPTSNTKKK